MTPVIPRSRFCRCFTMDPLPSSYSKSRQIQIDATTFILKKYSKEFRWRKDGHETLLDVGCGPGDDLKDLILPLVPEEFGEVVGVDISQKMVDYAKQNFERNNLRFEVLDIENIHPFLSKYPKGFDHVTSFYVLNWMRSLNNAVKNIRDLLSPGGDCLLVFFVKQPVIDVFDQLAKKSKWNKFMSSAYDHLSTFLNKEDAVSLATDAFEQAGFSHYKLEVLKRRAIYTGDDAIKANLSVIHPAFPKMSALEQSEYWQDFFDLTAELKLYEKDQDPGKSKLDFHYELAVVYAVK